MNSTYSTYRTAGHRSPWRGFSASALGLLLILSLAGCTDNAVNNSESAAGTPVRTATVRSGPGAAPIHSRGKIAAAEELQLSFKTGGIIARVHIREGERVQAGQLLAELALDEIAAQAAQAAALAEKAERDLVRAESLHAAEVISLEALENARTQAEIARNSQRAARFNLQYSRIVAPRDGVVLRRFVEERELIAPGQPVLTLGADDEGYVVRAALSDRELVQVSIGDSARVRLDAYPDREWIGVIHEIAGAADPISGLFPLEVSLQNEEGVTLSSGLVAKLTIQPASASARTRVYVPVSAVVEGDGRTANVFLIESGVARKRAVTVDFIVNEEVAVMDGLTSKDVVITEGALYLQDGDRVRVLDDAPVADSLSEPKGR